MHFNKASIVVGRKPDAQMRRPAQGGFMLLEIVIAVGIFAFAVVGLATAMNRLIDVELISREDLRVRMELDSKLAEARLAEVKEGTTDLGEDGSGLRYRVDIKPAELRNADDKVLDGLFLFKVSALRGDEIVQSVEMIVNSNAK